MESKEPFFCRMCGNVITPKSWGGGECDACGSVSVTDLPTDEELTDFYQSFNTTYTGGGRSGGRNLRRYAQCYLNLVQSHVDTGELIDIGSSTNPFPNIATRAGFNVTVMDYAQPTEIDSQVNFVEGNLNDEKILLEYNSAFDVVTAWAVIEHVSSPQLACSMLARMCRPRGIVVLTTPEIGTFMTNNSIGRSGWFCPPEHLHLISPIALKIMFEDNDCDIIKWGRLELDPIRYAARYGIGMLETIVGMPFKSLLFSKWQRLRDAKVHKFKGITYFVFKRRQHEIASNGRFLSKPG